MNRITTFQVEGRVASRSSAGVGGLHVRIVDKAVGADLHLAEVVTGESGAYHATFSDAAVRGRGKAQPDLQARVFAGGKFIAASAVRYNAGEHETLNVVLDETATAALRSEHETLTGTIALQFKGHPRDLQETDDRQDITYLANKTGWDARAVALAALADQFSARTGKAGRGVRIAPALFYALFRAGVPANEATLYHTDARTVEGIWKQAAAAGVIPAALANGLPKAVEQFRQLAAQRALDGPAMVGVSPLKELVSISLGDDAAQQQQFADLYVRHKGDLPAFWAAVRGAFGEGAEQRLRVDGQLAYLTMNNAPLMRKLHRTGGDLGLTDPLQLVAQGFYQRQQWQQVIGSDPIPGEIPGADDAEKRSRYAEVLAAQVRLSFPTAVVAQMVAGGATPVSAERLREPVAAFLMQHQGKFELGVHPVELYARQNKLPIDEVTREITRIQRVHQITPGDDAMNLLLHRGIDSAYAVTRYGREEFVRSYQEALGGEAEARQIHARAQQVHNAVLNIALSYLSAGTAPGIGVHSPPKIVDPAPTGSAANAGDVIAYPTLEKLLGSMDYCACDHCRSILSPAAYLVDLLLFLDRDEPAWGHYLADWQSRHGGAAYPFADPAAQAAYVSEWQNLHPGAPVPGTDLSPLAVLLSRRPDLEHLPLTCENTNTPLPYIDVVNETLEYYVTHSLQLAGYIGHSTDGSATPEELLASPQFTSDTDAAYALLAGKAPGGGNPPLLPPTPPLPFHRPLEHLRRYFDHFAAPLPAVMEALRQGDLLERADPAGYGWRDIWMEELRISRAEYRLLTDRTLTLQQLYGYPVATPIATVLAELGSAKGFTRRMGISYADLVAILQTSFVNPHAVLIPKLERLGVPFKTLQDFKNGALTDKAFMALLPAQLDESQYGGDVRAWVKHPANYANIMGLLSLAHPGVTDQVPRFEELAFRYVNPDNNANQPRAFEFVRLFRFIRLWRKLGWSMAQVDQALMALYPGSQLPNHAQDAVNLQRLDAGFLTLLPRLGVVHRVLDALKLKVRKDLQPLLACFAPIDAYGANSLYRQMFLSPALLNQDAAFADDGYGNFLDGTQTLMPHAQTLRAAFGLTSDEFVQITAALQYDDSTTLTLGNSAAIFRRGWLARKLKLSVREFLLLTRYTGLDPFAAPDPTAQPAPDPFATPDPAYPPVLRLIQLLGRLRALPLKPVQALYLIWNQDVSGKSAPADSEVTGFARTLRGDFAAIESEFALADDPDGQIARARIALVYDNDATEQFFGLLERKAASDVPYSHGQATLEQPILDAAPGVIAYDNLRKRLSYSAGAMSEGTRAALKGAPGVTAAFAAAVDALYAKSRAFFDRYPELQPLHEGYVFFVGLQSAVAYSQAQATLAKSILDAAPGRIRYDNQQKLLSFTGVLNKTTRDALQAAAGATAQFQAAVDDLFAACASAIQALFGNNPSLAGRQAAYLAADDAPAQQRAIVLAALLPELKRRRKHQHALQAIAAAARAEVGFAGALLDDATVLHAAGDNAQPALAELTAMETPGLSAQFFYQDTLPNPLPQAPDLSSDAEASLAYAAGGGTQLPANPAPGKAISAIWSGCLEVPENGYYNLAIETDAGATVTLAVGGATVALAQSGGVWSNSAPIELRAGALYAIRLEVEQVKATVNVRWETTGRGWETIPSRYLYPANLTGRLHAVYVRFLKAAALASALQLTAAETAYLAANPDCQVGGEGWLNRLPVTGSPDQPTCIALLKVFTQLLDFARIKAGLSPGDERLLAVLRDPAAATQHPDSLLFAVTRWEPASLGALLSRFGLVVAGLGTLTNFRRVCDAYGWVNKLGVPAPVLITAAANEPDAGTVRDLQGALRSRYAETEWLDVVRPINDELRALQRDALVAYILHQMRAAPATAHIDTPDKLFEYFLMDVQMEPVMQTSRIRHALSSVQLFIDRALMNLEPRVAASALNATDWQWMSRYRVWEANRKVFLYPENWLEPELRDDQSPFFKEAMSELLQGDITEDSAATALLHYLAKLEEVAKLEPCGIRYVEYDPNRKEGDVAHVVARTAGGNRKYFYRRSETGHWTPWEQIKLDIEDNPVVPVVWKNRLFLFWLRIIKEAAMQQPQLPNDVLTQVIPAQLAKANPDAAKVLVKAILCWSEYYNGKWQPTKTSDVSHPTLLGMSQPADFNRSGLTLLVAEVVAKVGAGQAAVTENVLKVTIAGLTDSWFILYNTHSAPVPKEKSGPVAAPAPDLVRYVGSGDDGTLVAFYGGPKLKTIQRLVLNNQIASRIVEPNHELENPWNAPFFYEDSRHVFYVTTRERLVAVPDWDGYVAQAPAKPVGVLPDLVLQEPPGLPHPGGPDGPMLGQVGFGVVDRSPMARFVSEDAYISRGLGTIGTVSFGDKEIGPAGSLLKAPVQQGKGAATHGQG